MFVAKYWPKVLEKTEPEMIDSEYVKKLLPISCDQRYGLDDIGRIIEIVKDDLICRMVK